MLRLCVCYPLASFLESARFLAPDSMNFSLTSSSLWPISVQAPLVTSSSPPPSGTRFLSYYCWLGRFAELGGVFYLEIRVAALHQVSFLPFPPLNLPFPGLDENFLFQTFYVKRYYDSLFMEIIEIDSIRTRLKEYWGETESMNKGLSLVLTFFMAFLPNLLNLLKVIRLRGASLRRTDLWNSNFQTY